MKNYDFLIIGSGLFGSVCARELTNFGYKCLVIEKRNHIGGNCYTQKEEGINIHKYGAHIFHTSNEEVWNYINKYIKFNNYRHHVIANYRNELYSLPFNMFTFNKLFKLNTPLEVLNKIESQKFFGIPKNLEEQAIYLVGSEVYEKLIKGYTIKQWMIDPKELPAEIIKRLPVRFNFDNNYFYDKFQGIPENGYTEFFDKLLNNIDVRLNVDYFNNRQELNEIAKKTIYSGPIDKFFNYKFGNLEYRPLKFIQETLDISNYQGCSVVNYTDIDIPYTRIIEHKHFENSISEKTIITKEYPIEWKKDSEPYYPINNKSNQEIYSKYLEETKNLKNVYFGGRLAEYKYYDMHQVIESALKLIKKITKK
jgi:UDP-galactopyranose mutase